MAHVITFPMTLEQFDKAQVSLDAAVGVSHTGDNRGGTVHSKQLDFDYTYDGKTFSMDITGRHGLEAKIASYSQILKRVEEMLA